MGFWFFLTVVVGGNMVLKAYKLKASTKDMRASDERIYMLERELKVLKDKVQQLDEAVFFGDFELKRQFRELEKNMPAEKRSA